MCVDELFDMSYKSNLIAPFKLPINLSSDKLTKYFQLVSENLLHTVKTKKFRAILVATVIVKITHANEEYYLVGSGDGLNITIAVLKHQLLQVVDMPFTPQSYVIPIDDEDMSDYDRVVKIKQIYQTRGDGNCLLHAVNKKLEPQYHVTRARLFNSPIPISQKDLLIHNKCAIFDHIPDTAPTDNRLDIFDNALILISYVTDRIYVLHIENQIYRVFVPVFWSMKLADINSRNVVFIHMNALQNHYSTSELRRPDTLYPKLMKIFRQDPMRFGLCVSTEVKNCS